MNKKLLIVLGCALLLFCGCGKANSDNGEMEAVANADYKTTDEKVLIRMVGMNQEFENVFKGDLVYDVFANSNINEFLFVNNILFAVYSKVEDDAYVKYMGGVAKDIGKGMCGETEESFLIDKNKGIVVELDTGKNLSEYNYVSDDGLYERFNCETYRLDFINTIAGYFIVEHTSNVDVIYTTLLKKLGMVDSASNIEADSEGIYVYTQYNDDVTPVANSYTKFNANGEKIG